MPSIIFSTSKENSMSPMIFINHDSNKKLIVAFDVDGTLIHIQNDTPRYGVIDIFKKFEELGCDMVVWSGGGIDYARHWCQKLGLDAMIEAKGDILVDIAFDDEEVKFGKVNIRV
jgi:hydroxymethylpyrimidine pyrophosphatase-like HAD family hydrolase